MVIVKLLSNFVGQRSPDRRARANNDGIGVFATLQMSTLRLPKVDKDSGVTLPGKFESLMGVAEGTLLHQIFQPSPNQTRSAWKSIEPCAVTCMTRCKTEYDLSIKGSQHHVVSENRRNAVSVAAIHSVNSRFNVRSHLCSHFRSGRNYEGKE